MIRVLHFYKTYYPDSLGGAEQAWWYAPRPHHAVVEAMRTLWDDQQLCATFGRNARALTHFSVEKMTAACALAYRDCIEMHGHGTAAVVGAANRQG
ncbi:hypothetical protein [Pseudomonas sp. RIT-To-2]|uniref:hypothetical protein n=1 Tax=Pseudomonas sp. RIT-To-2 TaxID=3462541 RepID=UPI002412F67A